jgi:hypothetical protein
MDEPPQIPVTLHQAPNDFGTSDASGYIADTPENRAALEAAAIPKCAQWRSENPEDGSPAPYCCSSYCDRCAGLRALDGVEPLTPNEWMTK